MRIKKAEVSAMSYIINNGRKRNPKRRLQYKFSK